MRSALGPALASAVCWGGEFTYEACCAAEFGPGGNADCWLGDETPFNFASCCVSQRL